MDVLLHISTADAVAIVAPLARALNREGADWGCFLTNDGVRAIEDAAFLAACAQATRVAVCEHSWDIFMPGRACPVELGSQTINSALMGETARVVSL